MTGPNFDLENSIDDVLADLEDEFTELLHDIRVRIEAWLAALAQGALSPDELKELLEGEKALLEMTALKKKVETKVLLNTLKRDLIDALIGIVKGKL